MSPSVIEQAAINCMNYVQDAQRQAEKHGCGIWAWIDGCNPFESAITKAFQNMKPIKLYESGHSDGYRGHPDGNFFLDKTIAAAFAHQKYGQGYGDVDEHFALEAPDGKFYLLKSDDPVALYSVEEARKSIKLAALKKLTKEEIKELGLE